MPTSTPPSPSDADLVAGCRAGDAQAWAALVQRYQRLVYAIVRRFGDDEHTAADVFQTVFSRLLQHLPRLTEPDRLQAWIVTTARREALLQRRRARRTESLTRHDDDGEATADFEPADDGPGPERQLDDLQQLHRVRLALDRLDERCRDLLTLLFADADDRIAYDQVGARLGMPVGSIGPTRARCLAKLRQWLV
jgi:RNA polymerase sigma factor (sigma-70 family)